ncbi:MAG TPA: hypothetical protein VEJ36_02475 [Nitrososphaerales archaeon]|nr:hypothetical protein [Nitrososphaerales archaeon]
MTIDTSVSSSNGVIIEGALGNSGTITAANSGTGSNGVWVYYGTFTSSGTVNLENDGSESYGAYLDYGTMTSSGTVAITNSGSYTDGIRMSVSPASTIILTNSGTMTIDNSGSDTAGIYDVEGAIVNQCDATINVETSTTSTDTGIYITGSGTITNDGGTIIGYSGTVTEGPSCATTTSTSSSTSTSTTTTTTTTTTAGEVEVSITLDQFDSYGTALSASNYFTVTYTQGGVPGQVAEEQGGLLTISVDQNTMVSISATSSGSGASQQWCLSLSSGACLTTQVPVGTSAVAVTYVYFDCLEQFVVYQVSGGSSALGYGGPQPPSFDYSTAPSTASSSQSAQPSSIISVTEYPSAPPAIWVVAGTTSAFSSVTYSSPDTPYEQWTGVPSCTQMGSEISCGPYVPDDEVGPFSAGDVNVALEYINQYEIQADYKVSGGVGYTAPTLSYTSGGAPAETLLTTSYAYVWMDVGSGWSANSPLVGSGPAEQWVCSICSGSETYDQQITLDYTQQYLISFGVIDLWDCVNAATSTAYLCSSSSPNVAGTISPSSPTWEDAGVPFEVTQTPATDQHQGYGLSCGYAPCYWTTSDSAGFTFPSGCTAAGDSCETEFTAEASGTISAYFGIPTSSGSSPTCGGGGVDDDGQCVCPEGSVMTGGGCACDGSGCVGMGDWVMGVDPGYVLVTAPDGISQVGCDSSGNLVDTLEGATISSCSGGTGTILIASPPTGVYKIQIFSVGSSSSYTIDFDSYSIVGGHLDKTSLSGTVSSGSPQTEYLTVGADGSLDVSSSVSPPSGVPELPPILGTSNLLLLVALLPLIFLVRRKVEGRRRAGTHPGDRQSGN